MERQNILYHVTNPDNVENIIEQGLKRKNKNRSTMAVYLSTSPKSWYQEGLSVLQVDISGLDDIHMTTMLPDLDEILVWGDIPPMKDGKNRITDITDHFRDATKKEET